MLSWLAAGCGDDDAPSPAEGPKVRLAAAASLPALRERARGIDTYFIYYGGWDAAKIDLARRHQLVVLHPHPSLTRETVRSIQQGLDAADPSDDVLVLAYVSIGEDDRTVGLTDAQLAADPRFRGDGSGPRVDPRGPHADGASLQGVAPLGAPSPGGTGFASWYLDDNSVDRNGTGDGIPDRNSVWGGCYVNAGDPAWFDYLLQATTADDDDTGFREILTLDHGRGLGCDGVFLDTLDTCEPNSWTDASSSPQCEFEWTAPGYRAFMGRLRDAFPDRVLIQNRGLFFFDSRLPHYGITTRGLIDFAFFESYRLDNSSTDNPHPVYYPDNRYNVTPKLMAEAGRPDGFRVLSLGYAEGPPDQMSHATLTGQSTLGFDSLVEDIRVAQELAGFRHYLTNRNLDIPNRFVLDHATLADARPPVWTSTWNTNSVGGVAAEATPRVGLQEAVAGAGSVTVRWDVALDLNPVRYRLYYRTTPFDFAADPDLASATRVDLDALVGAGYEHGPGPTVFPNEDTVTGLQGGQTYYFVLRATDGTHEEKNQVVRTATPVGLDPLVAKRSMWRYHDQGANLGTAWRETSYADVSWPVGPGPLGYGESYLQTALSFGPDPALKPPTAYFRTTFPYFAPFPAAALHLFAMADDGFVAYLNGTEIARRNLPTSPVTYSTLAQVAVEAGNQYVSIDVTAFRGLLLQGTNLLAVEVHQGGRASSDLVWDGELVATPSAGPDPSPPVVSIVSPAEGAVVSGIVPVRVAASDDVGVTKVEVFVDSQLIGTVVAPPYDVPWDTRTWAPGPHTLTARAFDAEVNASVTSPRTVTVDNAPTGPVTLIAPRSSWRYHDGGQNLGTAWKAFGYGDSAWKTGLGPLGYGERYLATVVSFGSNAKAKPLTVYFRSSFTLTDPASLRELKARLMYDDGFVLHLNGTEVRRVGLGTGAVGFTTRAASHEARDRYEDFDLSAWRALLRTGLNEVAVEIHQDSPGSGDLVFDLSLDGVR